jgi:guanylate kinase
VRSKQVIYVVSGPSGSGKSTLIGLVLAELEGTRFSVSHTTRKKRAGETEGRDYYFVSPEKFRNMIKGGRFVEWAVVHGAYYGTSKKELRKGEKGDLILDIDVQGARQVRAKIRKAVFIFVLPPDYAVLKKRLEGRRVDSPAAIQARLAVARKEVKDYSRFDHVLINDDLDDAAAELASIIRCHRSRLAARRAKIKPILQSFGKG